MRAPKEGTDNEKKQSYFVRNCIIAFGSASMNMIAETLCYPFDTMNTWIKVTSRKQKILKLIRKNIKTDGFWALYRGVNTQFYVSMLPSFIYFFLYETLNRIGGNFLKYMGKDHYAMFLPTLTAGISESCSLMIMVPMDALKTRLQMNSPEYRYTSIMNGLTEIIRKEGYIRLFKASPIYICHAIVFNVILFQSYELFRIRTMKAKGISNDQLTFVDSLKNTALATMIAMAVTNPLDLILTRYQVIDSSRGALSLHKVVRDVIRNDGFLGLNRGVWFRTFYGCIEACMLLPFYEELRKKYGHDFAAKE